MPKVFIAYGRDHEARDATAGILKRLGIEPVVFSKSPDQSLAVIEKFEHAARQCEFAIVILTPDDRRIVGTKRRVEHRARQNVIFEMGWFFGRLGRSKTLLIRKGAVGLPSDIRGVLYKQYRESPAELRDEIVAALRVGGVRVVRGQQR